MSMALHHRERSFAIFVSEAALASRSSTDQLPGSRRTSVPRMAPSMAKHPLFHTSEMAMPLERGTAFRRSQSLGSPDKANLERLMIHGTRQGPCTLEALLVQVRCLEHVHGSSWQAKPVKQAIHMGHTTGTPDVALNQLHQVCETKNSFCRAAFFQ